MDSKQAMLLGLWLLFGVQVVMTQTWDDAKQLMTDLKSSYDKNLRPVEDQTKPVYVNVSLDLVTILDIDEVEGKITIMGFLSFIWYDANLGWDPATYNNIYTQLLNVKDVWIPPLTLTNPMSKVERIGEDGELVRVIFYGIVYYFTGDVFQASCSLDITYYPYDSQECNLFFSVLPYSATEVVLISTHTELQKNYFSENGEWTLTSTSASAVNINGGYNMVFTLRLKRKPAYTVMNMLMPIVLMTVLNLLVFILPSDSGERVGYSVTLLLAVAVFLTLVSDNLPKTSEPLPIFGTYLTVILILSVLMCVMTIISLFFYHKDENKEPPVCLQIIAKIILCRVCFSFKSRGHSDNVVRPLTTSEKNRVSNESQAEDSAAPIASWKDVSRAIDVACLFSFTLATIIANTYFLVTLGNSKEEDRDTVK